MTVSKRGGVYHYEFVYKGDRYRGSTGASTKVKALEFEKKVRDQLYEQAALGRAREMTMGEAVESYTRGVLRQKPKYPDGSMKDGVKNDLLRLDRIERHFGSETPISKISTQAAIAKFSADLFETMKASSVNRYYNVLRAVLNRAYDEGGLLKPPKIKSNKVDDAREVYLSAEQEDALLLACPPHLRNYIMFCLDTGARKDEARRLTWDRVELKKTDRSLVHLSITKGSKPRTIPLPKRTADLLKALHKVKPEGIAEVFVWQADRNVNNNKGKVVLPKGAWASLGDVSKAWRTARKAADLDGVRIQDLRHTYASKLVKNGVPILDVSKLMGHSSIQMTMRYAHLAPDHLESAVSALD